MESMENNTSEETTYIGKKLDFPKSRASLGFFGSYNHQEASKLMQGFLPQDMDDKWYIYYENGWLYFLRSWSGATIFALCLGGTSDGVRVIDSWVNREPDQFNSQDTSDDRRLLSDIIDFYFLGRE